MGLVWLTGDLLMTPTVYAAFTNANQAEAAAAMLLDQKVPPDEISLIVHERKRSEKEVSGRSEIVPDDGLNPAQNDYPASESGTSDGLSSAPPEAPRMYNAGLETREYNRGYVDEVEKENARERELDRARSRADADGTPLSLGTEGDQDTTRIEAEGISRPTIADTKTTVAASAGLGLGVGALAAVSALAFPGLGLVIGGGALATAVAGLAASSTSDDIGTDGIVGYLKDQGVPADVIVPMRTVYDSGGAILAVSLKDSLVDATEVESILRSYDGIHVGTYEFTSNAPGENIDKHTG